MATAPPVKKIRHILRNKALCLGGAAKEIEGLSKLSCRHCRYSVFEKLIHIADKLKEYGKELSDLSGEFKD